MGTYGSSKATQVAIVAEVAAGTPVEPSAATDYLAIQPDFELSPNFEVLENEEIRASIGKSKVIQGLEQPEGGMSHYLKHSGVEGQSPEWNLLLKSLFGSETVNNTQRTTTSSSTTSLLKLGAGGSDFARGFAVLIKDPTNGYSIRPVHSVSSDDLTLGFNVSNAPATGLGVGKCVNFSPANSGHPTLTIHGYRGNGQAKDMLAGAIVQEMQLQVQAGQMVNCAFSWQGTSYYFNPIKLSAVKYVDFDIGSSALAAAVAAGTYRTPHDLASAIQAAMNAVSADAITVRYLDNHATNGGKFSITTAGAELNLLWNTGSNTANTIASLIGYSAAADDTGSLSYVSDSAQSYASPYTPTLDSSDPLAAKNHEVFIGDADDNVCFCVQDMTITVTNELTNVGCVCAESGIDQKKVTGREVKVTIKALLDKHDVDKLERYRTNAETRFAYNFGVKSGGNWVAGKCGNFYIPTCTVSRFSVIDSESLIAVEMELSGFVDSSGNGEVYLNFL